MKRTWIVIMAFCAALTFTACGKSPANTETTPAPGSIEADTKESDTKEPETKESDANEPATTPAATLEAPGNTAEFKILTSEVKAVSDTLEDMTVKNGDADIRIVLKDVMVETTYALEAGTPVSVIYKGEISGDDASNADFVLIVDAQKDLKVETATGSVKDQAMSTFTIQEDGGEDVSFLKDNCEGLNTGVLGQAADDSNGSGARVKVTYITVSYDAGSEAKFPLKVEAAE